MHKALSTNVLQLFFLSNATQNVRFVRKLLQLEHLLAIVAPRERIPPDSLHNTPALHSRKSVHTDYSSVYSAPSQKHIHSQQWENNRAGQV